MCSGALQFERRDRRFRPDWPSHHELQYFATVLAWASRFVYGDVMHRPAYVRDTLLDLVALRR